MDTTGSRRARLRAQLGALLGAALAAGVLAGCGAANAPGRPQPNTPESSYAKTPGTPRGAGTRLPGGRAGVPNVGPNMKAGRSGGRTTPGTTRPGANKGGANDKHMTSAPGVPKGGAQSGFAGTAAGLFGWGLGRPPGGLGRGLGGGATGRPKTGGRSHAAPGQPAGARKTSGLGARSQSNGGTARGKGGTVTGAPATAGGSRSPYANARTRALADRLGGAHRTYAGTYAAPAGHKKGQPLSQPPSLTTLPAWQTLEHYNGYLVSYAHLTPWVASMGAHWGPRGPGLVLMQNENRAVTAVETAFPAKKGWEPWFDQPQGKPADTIYSEHLYFVAPSAITKAMSTGLPTDLTSWRAFSVVNAAKTSHYKAVGTDPSGRATQYGPPAEGIRVLVDGQSHVVGMVGAWPSNSPQGWRPWFDQKQGAPIQDAILGSVYTQHLWLVDPRSLPPVTQS